MKLAPTTRRTSVVGPTQPPLLIDDLGCCRAVIASPDTDAAWLALTTRLPPGGGYLAARLTACLSRAEQAGYAVAGALKHVGDWRGANPERPLPARWVDRLGELWVEEFDALCCLDDAAHAGALAEPRWVEVAVGERPVPAEECSWVRVSRIVARELQAINGLNVSDEVYTRWVSLDAAARDAEAGDAAGARERGRHAIRLVIAATYGEEEATC
jgi:hypothetical protein